MAVFVELHPRDTHRVDLEYYPDFNEIIFPSATMDSQSRVSKVLEYSRVQEVTQW